MRFSAPTSLLWPGALALALIGCHDIEALRRFPSSLRADQTSAHDWPMFARDVTGTRYNANEVTLTRAAVGARGLKEIWRTPLDSPAIGTPAVIHDRTRDPGGGRTTVYVGSYGGNVYALDADDGRILWVSHINGFTGTPLVAEVSPLLVGGRSVDRLVIVGDQQGFVFALDPGDGSVVWTQRPNHNGIPAIYAGPTQLPNGDIIVAIASAELIHSPVGSSRGSLHALDPRLGLVKWSSFMVSDDDYFLSQKQGASVWSQPAYDAELDLLFVGTGQNFGESPEQWTGTSNSLIAIDADPTGCPNPTDARCSDRPPTWITQFVPGNANVDVGDSPALFTLACGLRVVAAGQKNGRFHVLAAGTGEVVYTYEDAAVIPAGELGGFFWDAAVANWTIYANGSYWPTVFKDSPLPNQQPAPGPGALIAIRNTAGCTLTDVWTFATYEQEPGAGDPGRGSANLSGVAVAGVPGDEIVYLHSSHAGKLFAINAGDGTKLAEISVGEGYGGPAISRGRIFLATGDHLGLVADEPSDSLGYLVAVGLGESR